jgi:hypothetical protein
MKHCQNVLKFCVYIREYMLFDLLYGKYDRKRVYQHALHTLGMKKSMSYMTDSVITTQIFTKMDKQATFINIMFG